MYVVRPSDTSHLAVKFSCKQTAVCFTTFYCMELKYLKEFVGLATFLENYKSFVLASLALSKETKAKKAVKSF